VFANTEEGQKAVASACFAVAAKSTGTSLNLEAPSDAIRESWLNGLKEIFKSKGGPCNGVINNSRVVMVLISFQATLLGAGGLFNGYFMSEDGKSAVKKPVYVWFDDYPSAKTKGAFYWHDVRVKSDENRFELATLTDVYPTKKAKV